MLQSTSTDSGPCIIGWPVTVFAVGVVLAAMIAQNLRNHGPFVRYEHVRTRGELWQAIITQRGWPFRYFEQLEISVNDGYSVGGYSPDWYEFHPPAVRTVRFEANDPFTWALCGNLVLTMLMVTSTAAVAENWRRQHRGPFQFRVRSLLTLTALVAWAMAMIAKREIDGWTLLNLPLALGLVSMPITAGIALERYVRRLDRRALRRRRRG